MGYRSKVRCLIYGPKEKLDSFLTAQAYIFGSSVFKDFTKHLTRYQAATHNATIDILDLRGDNWKWYEHYPDVKAWVSFMRESIEFDLEYEFIRVGEGEGDDHDVEKECSTETQQLLYLTQPEICEDFNSLKKLLPLFNP